MEVMNGASPHKRRKVDASVPSDDEVKQPDFTDGDDGSSYVSVSTEAAQQELAEREIARLISRARKAQKVADGFSQERVDLLIKAMVWSVCKPGVAEKIATLAVKETRLGNYEGKFAKIATKTRCALLDIINDKSVGLVERDEIKMIDKIAKPVGVIGATSPSTNPEATPVIKAINAVKGRNSIIISPHPRAEETNQLIVDQMRKALTEMGAPADLVIHVEAPTRLKTKALMKLSDLAFATGGSNIAKNALTSGKPSYPSGVGNAVIFVDDSADLEFAAVNIRRSKTFDFAASCSADNAVLARANIYDSLVAELKKQGGVLVSTEEHRSALAKTLFKYKPGSKQPLLNPSVVVQSAKDIARLAGIPVDDSCEFLIVPETGVGQGHPFSGEKLSPVLALYRVDDAASAAELTNLIHNYQGRGHSCGVYARSEERIDEYAGKTRTARVMVNQPQSHSNSGSLANGMPVTLSLGCGTWGGSTASANINWRHLVNITHVSRPLPQPKSLPSDAQLFQGVL